MMRGIARYAEGGTAEPGAGGMTSGQLSRLFAILGGQSPDAPRLGGLSSVEAGKPPDFSGVPLTNQTLSGAATGAQTGAAPQQAPLLSNIGLGRQYVPFTGDPLRYGMGPEHNFFNYNQPAPTAPAGPGSPAAPGGVPGPGGVDSGGTAGNSGGGPSGGPGDYGSEPRGNDNALAGMSAGDSPSPSSGLSLPDIGLPSLSGIGDYVGGHAFGLGGGLLAGPLGGLAGGLIDAGRNKSTGDAELAAAGVQPPENYGFGWASGIPVIGNFVDNFYDRAMSAIGKANAPKDYATVDPDAQKAARDSAAASGSAIADARAGHSLDARDDAAAAAGIGAGSGIGPMDPGSYGTDMGFGGGGADFGGGYGSDMGGGDRGGDVGGGAWAKGGRVAANLLLARGGMPQRGIGAVSGPGGGTGDAIPAMLSDGEHIVDSSTVAALGDGSNAEGQRRMEMIKRRIRSHARSAPASQPAPKAKGIGSYMRGMA